MCVCVSHADEGPEPAAAPGEEVQGVAGLHAPQHDLAAQAAAAGLELRSSNSSVRTEALQRALEQDETGTSHLTAHTQGRACAGLGL